MIAWVVVFFLLSVPEVWATIRHADNQLGADCTNGTYSFTSRTCGSGSDGDAYTTFAAAITPTVAGDQICVRSGTTWTTQMDLQTPNKSGTAAGGYITIGGCNGEIPTIRFADPTTGLGYGAIKVRGNRGYFIFENMILDGGGSNDSSKSGWSIRDGNHHFILRNLEIKNFKNVSAIYLDSATDITIQRCKLHDIVSTLQVSGTFHYGIYGHDGARWLIEENEIYNNAGGGLQLYPGPLADADFRRNKVHDNNTGSPSGNIHIGGIEVRSSVPGGGGTIERVNIYDNWFYNNGSDPNSNTAPGIEIHQSASSITRNVNVFNNVVYGNKNFGIQIGDSGGTPTVVAVQNNVMTGNNGSGVEFTTTGSPTVSFNACLAAESCGATNKVTIASATAVMVDPANSDFRLVQGTNALRNAGTTVSTRPSPVGATDVGSTEQGSVTSAVVASSFIEVTISVMTPGVLPAAGITTFTIANGTSTGTPVVGSAVIKAGSNNIVQLTVSGFTGNGSCTVSYGAGNMTDSLFVGGSSNGVAQGVNSVTNLAVTGTCMNSAGATPPASGLHIHYKLNENAGTNANDETANNLDGTLVNSPTWTTPVIEGSGLYFPSDGTDKKVTIPYGDALNPTSNSFTFCVWLKPDSGLNSKIAFGALSTTNRLYVGYSTTTWGIGIGSSSFSSGQSEFPVSNTNTRVCLINNAATDTATLAVNGVIGTSAAAVKSTTGFTDLASDFRLGCSILSQSYCGGFTMDEVKIWTGALSAAEILEDFSSYTPAGGSVVCYKQQNHRWQRVSLDPSLAAENMGATGATVDIVENGAVALVIQIDCTGSAGSALALRAFYSTNGSTFSFPIPSALGSDSIAFWGDSTDAQLNRFTATCCLSGALTANDGVTILSSVVTPTITLSQNHSYTVRLIIRVGAIAGQSRYIRLYQDNGAVLAGGYTTTPQLNVVPMKANSGP